MNNVIIDRHNECGIISSGLTKCEFCGKRFANGEFRIRTVGGLGYSTEAIVFCVRCWSNANRMIQATIEEESEVSESH